MPRIGPFVLARSIDGSSFFCNLRRFCRFAANTHAQKTGRRPVFCRIPKHAVSTNAEKNSQTYAPDAARHSPRPAAGPGAALCSGRSGPGPATGRRLRLPDARHGGLRRTHPPRLSAAADGGQHPAGRQDGHAPPLRKALARRRPVAADPQRGRHPELRAGTRRRPLQGHLGGHGPAPGCGRVVPRSRPRRSFGQHGRHLPARSRRRGHPAEPDRSGSRREKGERRRPAVDGGTRQNRGLEPRLRDADLPCGLRTLRPPGRRERRHLPGAAGQPAGLREKRPARPGRLLLPHRTGRSGKRDFRRDDRSVGTVDRPGRPRRADRQQRRIRPAGPPSRRGVRPGVHRPRAARPHD